MDYKEIVVNINRNDEISLSFELEELQDVVLSKSEVKDIENLFDSIFSYVVDNGEMLNFKLDDDKNDLFHDVSNDIINQLNSEIRQSHDKFTNIRNLIES